MKDGLKIYACSGFGVGTAPEEFDYWLDNTSTIHNTCAVNSLLAEINFLSAKLAYEKMSDDDVLLSLNLIDLYSLCLYAAESYSGDELLRMGTVIGWMRDNGAFTCTSLDNDERDRNLDELLERCGELFYTGGYEEVQNEFTTWFYEHVVLKDYVGLSHEQIENVESALSGSVSGTTTQDAGDALFQSGGYYLYLYLGEKQAAKMGKVIYAKYRKELEVYNYMHKAYDSIIGSKEAVDKIIYSGICSSYQQTPESVCKDISGKPGQKGIGIGVAAICSIILAVVQIIAAVLSIVLTIVGATLQTKYTEPNDPDFGTPGVDGEDIDEIKGYNKNKEGQEKLNDTLSKVGIIAGIALLLYGIFK